MSSHWFRYKLGAIRHQAITWTNDDPVHWSKCASPGVQVLKLDVEQTTWITKLDFQALIRHCAMIFSKGVTVGKLSPSQDIGNDFFLFCVGVTGGKLCWECLHQPVQSSVKAKFGKVAIYHILVESPMSQQGPLMWSEQGYYTQRWVSFHWSSSGD